MKITNTGSESVSLTLLGTRYQLAPTEFITLKDEDYLNVVAEIKKLDDLEISYALSGILNPLNIYADIGSGNDTNGDGSEDNPFKTLPRVILAASDPSKNYVAILGSGEYDGVPVVWPGNISCFSYGVCSIKHALTYVGAALAEHSFVFDGIGVDSFELDLSVSAVAIITFQNGSYNIKRTDSASGPKLLRVNSANISSLDVTGNILCSNILFVGSIAVKNAGALLLANCIVGVSATVLGTGTISMVGCTFPGTITGTDDGGNTPTVITDSTSLSYGGTITGANVTLSDTATSIAYAAGTPGDWDVSAPTTVKTAIDRIAASIKANHGTGP